MSLGWFVFIIGFALVLYGGGVLLKDRLLEWAQKMSSVKLVALVCIILGAFMIYTAAFLLWMT
jgi:uncharacterized membrane protein